ncbi:hypothetical protein MVEN_01693500 [Mycena venus]|uniref:Uncharacterized protein n=1 Tax=Mycena venus TaxID=2733690 RepID=A0A8H6XLV5_9AGAR|nr:hypothetical protein MVEN_01693500 [Mycena venus]
MIIERDPVFIALRRSCDYTLPSSLPSSSLLPRPSFRPDPRLETWTRAHPTPGAGPYQAFNSEFSLSGGQMQERRPFCREVCDTTDDPEIQPTSERGEHDISDELVFTNNRGYVFHDSRGFENGDEEQLKIVQNFVRDRSKRNNLKERLHAIWFCISADTRRPGLDIAPFNKICPDENVPMIAVFTKYEALRHTIRCGLEDDDEDDGGEDLLIRTSRETERIFEKEFLGKFDEKPRFVRLESMDQPGKRCDNLIETTMVALNDEIVTLMLLAVQRQNLQFSVRTGVRWAFDMHNLGDSGWPVKECLRAFPSLWFVSPAPSLALRRR